MEQKLVKKHPVIKALDTAFEQNGFKIYLLMRLAPILPSYNIINYIGGVTSIKLSQYAWALLGIIPGTILYSFLGATTGSLTSAENSISGPVSAVAITLGVVFGLLAAFAISYYAKREFDNILEQERQRGQEDGFANVEDEIKVETEIV